MKHLKDAVEITKNLAIIITCVFMVEWIFTSYDVMSAIL